MATPAWELIDSNTLSSSASSVTFSAIPQGYRDLVLVTSLEEQNGFQSIKMIFNGASTGYSSVYMLGTGSAAQSGTGSSAQIYLSAKFPDAGQPLLNIIQIMDYSATDKHKTVLQRANIVQSDRVVEASAARYASTSAIISIQISTADTFIAGSTFYLWGLNRL